MNYREHLDEVRIEGSVARAKGHAINHCPKYSDVFYEQWVIGWREQDLFIRTQGEPAYWHPWFSGNHWVHYGHPGTPSESVLMITWNEEATFRY